MRRQSIPRLAMLVLLVAMPHAVAQRQVPATTPAPPPGPQTRNADLPMTREGVRTYLAEYDAALAALRLGIKRWNAARELPTDFRDTTARRDVLRYVLQEDVDARMQAQRTAAQSDFEGGDWPGVRVQLAPAVTELNGATERFVGIVSYWQQRVVYDRRMKAWAKAVKSNGLANPHGPELARLEAALDQRILAGQFGTAAREDLPRMLALFARGLDEARAATPDGVLVDDPMRRMPKKPCDTTAAEDRGAAPMAGDGDGSFTAPRLDLRRSKPTFAYYPPIAAALGIEGVVTLRVHVTETGCVAWAETTNSSRVSVLDDAGMDWAVNGAVFAPGTDGQRPVDTRSEFNVRFKLDR